MNCRTPNSSGKASAVVSPVMASSYHAASRADEESSGRPLCLSQGSQYNDIDWHNYETSILERNEAGSFYIPSGKCTRLLPFSLFTRGVRIGIFSTLRLDGRSSLSSGFSFFMPSSLVEKASDRKNGAYGSTETTVNARAWHF